MQVFLQLNSAHKSAIEELFLISAQLPAFAQDSGTCAQDGVAVFRVAKEFNISKSFEETAQVDSEDLARILRFVAWLLSYGNTNLLTVKGERQESFRHLMAAILLQAQSQYSGFEALLKSYGVDRQLGSHVGDPPLRSRNQKSLRLERTDRTHEVRIRVDERGAEMGSKTVETVWTAEKK